MITPRVTRLHRAADADGFRRVEVVYDTLQRGSLLRRTMRRAGQRLRARLRPRHSDVVVHAWR